MQVRGWVVDEFDWFDVREGVERDVDEGGRDVRRYGGDPFQALGRGWESGDGGQGGVEVGRRVFG
jgi:hypothetical protein